MGNNSKISSANIKDNLSAKLISFLTNNDNEYTRIFYFGQVVINDDDKNNNRVKVRIPLIDDIFFKDVDQETGNNSLPWCMPISSRFITTPENNSIVVVILSDPKTPFYGRIYLDTLTDLSATDLYEKLSPEEQSLSNWLNVQNAMEINIPTPIDEKKFNVKNKSKYKIGIRGKGNNKIELDQNNLLITQNNKDKNKESFINLAENTVFEVADKIDIVSKKGRNKKYHPVFDTTLFDYLQKQNQMIQKIVILLNTIPAIAPIGGPCTAAPNAQNLLVEFNSLKAAFAQLKQKGYSEKITIN